MAINFTRLFTSEGLYCGALNEANTFRGTLTTRAATLRTQWATADPYLDFISPYSDTLDAAKSAQDGYLSALGSLVSETIVNEVSADRPLTDTSLAAALAELVRQMGIASETLTEMPCTASVVDVGTPNGDHTFVAGRYEGLTGRVSDFMVPDVYLIQCSADRSSGGTQYAETFTVVGKPADSLPTDSTYPSGTGINTTLTAIDPGSDGGLVTDGAFPNWTGNTPDSPWVLGSGTIAGTHIIKSTDTPRSSGFSANLVGDGSVIPKVRQEVTVTASTNYSVCFRVKKVADPGTDWMLSARLVDGTGAAITGNAGYVNLISSATAGSVATTWANPVSGQFCTPAVLPTTGVFVELVLSQNGAVGTAPANGASALVSFVSVQAETALYPGGLALTAFSGLTEGHVGDARTCTVAFTSGTASASLLRGMDRLLSGALASAAVRIPTTAAGTPPTQPNSLVT